MKLNEIAALGPRFIGQLTALAMGPKRFVRGLDPASPTVLRDALTFFVLALVVVFIVETPFHGTKPDDLAAIAVNVVYQGAYALVYTLLLWAVFRLVRGQAGWRAHLVPTLYFFGVGLLIWSLSALLARGVMHQANPSWSGQYEQYMELLLAGSPEIEGTHFQPMVESEAMFSAMMVMLVGEILMVGWFLLTWGAYRTANGVTPRRSAVAMVLFVAIAAPVTYILAAVQHQAGLKLF